MVIWKPSSGRADVRFWPEADMGKSFPRVVNPHPMPLRTVWSAYLLCARLALNGTERVPSVIAADHHFPDAGRQAISERCILAAAGRDSSRIK